MPPTPTVERPQRWDAAFDPAMTDADVDRLFSIPPFSEMNPENFPKRTPLREVLKHDTAIRRYRKGEIIVRQGDYGTSAFLILSGATRVVLKPDLPPSYLGRQKPVRKGVFRTLAQLWSTWRPPESFKRSQLRQDAGVGARQNENDEVHIFLHDLPPSNKVNGLACEIAGLAGDHIAYRLPTGNSQSQALRLWKLRVGS